MRTALTLSIAFFLHVIPAHAADIDGLLQPVPGEVAGRISFAAFSPLGDMAATCSARVIQIWNVADCKLLKSLALPEDGHEGELCGVAFSPDGETVASIQIHPAQTRSVIFWKLTAEKFDRRLGKIRSGPSTILSDLAFSPDGESIWASDGSTLYRWDVKTGVSGSRQLEGVNHGRIWYPTKSLPFLISGMAHLQVHQAETGEILLDYRGERLAWGALYDKASKFVAVASSGILLIGDSLTGKELARLRPINGRAKWAQCGGRLTEDLYVFTDRGCLERWDLRKQECTGIMAKSIAVSQSYVDEPVEFGQPAQSAFLAYQPTPFVVSPMESEAVLLSGQRFVIVTLDWLNPQQGPTSK